MHTPGYSATLYNEAVSGDLSNNGLAPTALTFSPGSNEVLGTTGANGNGTDRDYFTITVPTGYHIGAIIELAGTQVGENVSFIAFQAGPQVTVSPTSFSATGLLGWSHYGPVASDTDILPAMSTPADGSSGFSSLPAGDYSFWIQDFNIGTFAYGFDVKVTPTPEPGTYVTSLATLLVLGFVARRRSKMGAGKLS